MLHLAFDGGLRVSELVRLYCGVDSYRRIWRKVRAQGLLQILRHETQAGLAINPSVPGYPQFGQDWPPPNR
jgi:hypothetical protein